MAKYQVSLRELCDKYGFEVNARGYAECPFCQDNTGKKRRKTLKLTFEKNAWRCPVCGASGRVLHLFARYSLGMDGIPSDKEGKSKLSDELYEFMGITDEIAARKQKERKTLPPPGPKRPVAPDDKLHAVYSAMAELPVFQLTPEHRKDLMRRGFTEQQIAQNGYRSYPHNAYIPPEAVSLYNSIDPKAKANLSSWEVKHTQFGLHIAKLLQGLGCNLDGIPGFYKFGGHWCLTYSPGILIPTRNLHGQIVVWQVRRHNRTPKYLTLSCSGRPGAVDDEVSRCHFPISNEKITANTKFIFTEGPLKADVAKALSSTPCAFVAIPGVGNTKDLLRCCSMLKKETGISQIYNGLDMDKLTNRYVRDGSASLCNDLANLGFQVIPMYWGLKYATEQFAIFKSIANARHVTIPPIDYRLPVYEKLSITAKALYDEAKIEPGRQTEGSIHWESSTKGIDDYLLSLKQKEELPQNDCIRSIRDMVLQRNADNTP